MHKFPKACKCDALICYTLTLSAAAFAQKISSIWDR